MLPLGSSRSSSGGQQYRFALRAKVPLWPDAFSTSLEGVFFLLDPIQRWDQHFMLPRVRTNNVLPVARCENNVPPVSRVRKYCHHIVAIHYSSHRVFFFRHYCPCIFSSSRLNSHIILWRTLHSAQPPLGTSATGFFPVHDRLYRPSWSAELSTLLSSRYFEAIPLQGQWTRLSSDRTYENWHFHNGWNRLHASLTGFRTTFCTAQAVYKMSLFLCRRIRSTFFFIL
jgi:hypothetical protein